MRLPRTIRLDPSDEFVFPHAAAPGEWAVSGAFRFWDRDAQALAGKDRQAFRAGLLGIASFGWSTLIAVAEADEADVEEATNLLAARLVERLGAPDLVTARTAAAEEIAFAASLCDGHPVNTLIAVQRDVENGEIRERFRTLKPKEDLHASSRAFELVPEDDEHTESVDLLGLGRER